MNELKQTRSSSHGRLRSLGNSTKWGTIPVC